MSKKGEGSTSKVKPKPIEEAPIVARKVIMNYVKVGGYKFDIPKFDRQTDYILWERQVKSALKASNLGKILRPKPNKVNKEDWKDIQEQAMSIVILYLQSSVLKQLGELV
jgi:hypothetical protein